MKLRDLGIWTALLLIPAVPVFAFYLVFKESNFVELHEVPSGVVAAGPIAAYFVLLYLGSRLTKHVSAESSPLSFSEQALVGSSWSFEAKSQHSKRDGTFKISVDERGRLSLSGRMRQGGGEVGSWKSTMAQCAHEQLEVLYDLSETGGGKRDNSTGLLKMSTEPEDPDTMSGTWGVVGDGDAFGELTCNRIK
jgi:hypothetical protein